MRPAPLLALLTLHAVAVGAGCITPIIPGIVDPGRGAEPMAVGATSFGTTGAVGMSLLSAETTRQQQPVVGAAGTLRVEHQATASTALVFDSMILGLPTQPGPGAPMVVTSLLAGVAQNLHEHVQVRGLLGAGTFHRFEFGSPQPPLPLVHVDGRVDVIASYPFALSSLDDAPMTLTPYGVASFGVFADANNATALLWFPAVAAGASLKLAPSTSLSLAAALEGAGLSPFCTYVNAGLRFEL